MILQTQNTTSTPKRNLLILILPALSAFLLFLTLPKFDISFFVWFALIPFFLFLDQKINKKTLILGCFIAGFFYTLAVLWPLTSLNSWWIKNPDTQSFLWSNKEVLLKIFIVLLSVYTGPLIFTAFGLIYKKIARGTLRDALIIPLLWIVLEIIREFLVLGFTWGELGYILHDNLLVLQIASIFGVYGLSFLIVMVNILIYLWLQRLWSGIEEEKGWKGTRLFFNSIVLALCIVIISVISFGFFSKKMDVNVGEKLSIVIIHPALSTVQSATLEGHNLYFSLIETALESKPDLIVLPENSLPWIVIDESKNLPLGYESQNKTIREMFDRLIDLSEQNPETVLLIGLHSVKNSLKHNSLIALENGELADIYNKRQILPLFEESPEFLLKKHVEPISRSLKPKNYIETNNKNLKIGAYICSEVIFPRLSLYEKVDLLVNVSNDSVFDNPLVGKQNHIMATIRAVENRRYILRSVKGGISSIIDPYGRVLKQSEGDDPKIIFGEIII